MERTVYLFMKDNLVVPEAYPREHILHGISEDIVLKDYDVQELDFYAVPLSNAPAQVFCYALPPSNTLVCGWTVYPIRSIIIAAQKDTADARVAHIVRAAHIMQWRMTSVFCGTCGTRNTDAAIELARLCPACGRMEYPRITPAVIVLITNNKDEILLAHNRNFPDNMFSLIAGFNEAGETLEETVHREVFEEVALRVTDIAYSASQPWPFPASLMIGWTARHESGAIHCDGVEIEEAHWFARDKLPALPGLGSIARYLINRWLNAF
ncbi:MAG: NAD(+) diphosphatase [Spirochaetaceae bacterium]|jgi:NAD+ diphosphatase|nr:NAD(+) diphosphatase [Spirochaetaceae bacterium]